MPTSSRLGRDTYAAPPLTHLPGPGETSVTVARSFLKAFRLLVQRYRGQAERLAPREAPRGARVLHETPASGGGRWPSWCGSKPDALARIRTGTPYGTAPSRQRVYQFHHQGARRKPESLPGRLNRSCTWVPHTRPGERRVRSTCTRLVAQGAVGGIRIRRLGRGAHRRADRAPGRRAGRGPA